VPAVLICSSRPVDADLAATVLWRHDFERHLAGSSHKAVGLARRLHLDVILVDAALPLAVDLVRTLRTDPALAQVSVAVLARPDGPDDREFLDAGVTEILRLPVDRDWDDHLLRLLPVAARRQARHSLLLEVESSAGNGPVTATAFNLSAGGMLIEHPRRLAVGQQLRISFKLPGSPRAIAGTALVVREDSFGRWGLEFLYLEGDGLERLRRFVETWSPA
jgi:CheY-like chemotaxis protein